MFLSPKSRYRLYGAKLSYPRLLLNLIFSNYKSEARQDVELFEAEIAADLGKKYAVALMHARNGVYLGVKHSISKERNEVILSPYTIVEVINMVIVAGGKPVFADVVPNTCNIDASSVESLITDKTAALIVTHLHGLLCDMDEIVEICSKHDILLFEDAAQSYGASQNGVKAGAFGDAGMFSFGMMKNLNSFHGGMIVTDNQEIYKACKAENETWPIMTKKLVFNRMLQGSFLSLATHPLIFKTFTYWVFRYGYLNDIDSLMKWSRSENNPVRRKEMPDKYKFQTPNILAKFSREQLPKVDELAKQRLATALLYHKGLSSIKSIELPPLRLDGSHTYMSFPIVVEDRTALMKYLMKNGRDVALQHMHNCANLDIFQDFKRDVPGAEKTANSILLLPTYPSYGLSEAAKTLSLVQRFFEHNQSS